MSNRNSKMQQLKTHFVQPFTSGSLQKTAQVLPPSRIDIFKEKNKRSSMFRILFLRGDIPCYRSFAKKNSTEGEKYFLSWKVSPGDLDYSHYLPIFFDGLCDASYPYGFIARYGIHDLLAAGGEKILPIISQLIIPIKKALNTKNLEIILATLRVLQHMCICGKNFHFLNFPYKFILNFLDPCIGVALVPFYRQILPTFNLFREHNLNARDAIDYDRVGRLGDVIEETLNILERCGGKDAFVNIKYSIPTYESCMCG